MPRRRGSGREAIVVYWEIRKMTGMMRDSVSWKRWYGGVVAGRLEAGRGKVRSYTYKGIYMKVE